MEPGVLLKHIGGGTDSAKVKESSGLQYNYTKFTHLLLHMDFI